MNATWPFIRRLTNIIFAYFLASVSSGFVVAAIMYLLNGGGRWSEFSGVLYAAVVMTSLLAAPPALVTILIGEWRNIRRRRYYAIAGMVIGLILSLIFFLAGWFPFVGFGYGAVAGLIYWYVAGSRAGVLVEQGGQMPLQIALGLLLVVMVAVCVTLFTGFSWTSSA